MMQPVVAQDSYPSTRSRSGIHTVDRSEFAWLRSCRTKSNSDRCARGRRPIASRPRGTEVASGVWIGSSDFGGQEGAARLGVDPGDLEVDVDEIDFCWLTDQLHEDAFGAETLLAVSKEPRGGMLTYDVRILAVPLPSGRRLYVQLADIGDELLGVARGPSADVRFLSAHGGGGVDIPVDVHVDELSAIDYIWTLAESGGYVHEALTDETPIG